MELVRILIQSLVALIVLLILCRMGGSRQISQMNMFDYVNSISIGSIAAELATNLEEWYKPFAAMLIFGIATIIINWSTCKSMALRKAVNGQPLILYRNDHIEKSALAKSMLDINEFLTQCRVAGYFDLNKLEYAILETNGQISFYPKAEEQPATPKDLKLAVEPSSLFVSLIVEGKIMQKNLDGFGKDQTWLMKQLHTAGIGQVSEVFFACCDSNGNFRAYRTPAKQAKKDHLFE